IFSPQLADKVFHVHDSLGNTSGIVIGGKAVMIHYIGTSIGSFVFGFISQWLRSRKKSLFIALVSLAVFIAIYFSLFNASVSVFYLVIFFLGVAQGYWAVFVTAAS